MVFTKKDLARVLGNRRSLLRGVQGKTTEEKMAVLLLIADATIDALQLLFDDMTFLLNEVESLKRR